MATNQVYSLHLRLDRAKEHLNSLDREARTFLDKDPCAILIDYDEKQGLHTIRSKILEWPPLRLALIASDSLHNLRSALDNLWWQLLSKYKPGGPGAGDYFPIKETEGGWGAFERGVKKYLPPELIERLDIVQPYKAIQHGAEATQHGLWILHELSRKDKHRELSTLIFLAQNPRIGHAPEFLAPGVDYAIVVRPDVSEDDSIVAWVTLTNRNPFLEAYIPFVIGFSKPIERYPVVDSIRHIYENLKSSTFPLLEPFLLE